MNESIIEAGQPEQKPNNEPKVQDKQVSTSIANAFVGCCPVRVKRERKGGWKMPPNTVYVGRGTKWGNPFKVVEVADNEWHVVAKENDTWNVLLKTNSHDEALNFSLKSYQYWLMPYTHKDGDIEKFYQSTAVLESIISELKGKNLACWCSLDSKCHADILLELANG